MGTCAIWVATPDALAALRWESLLGREGWSVSIRASLDEIVRDAGLLKSLAVVDYDAVGRHGARALAAAKAATREVSFLIMSGRELETGVVIALLEAGADDFFAYSLPDALLLAKLRTHLRRLAPAPGISSERIEAPAGDIRLDLARREVRVLDCGAWIAVPGLTSTEIKLIGLFLGSPGQALQRRFILETVWADESERVLPSTVDKHVESLRRKLGKLGARIQTIYGVGYAYREGAGGGGKA